MSPDFINGLFEFGAAVAVWVNVATLWRDGQLKGVHWAPAVFFLLWGLFNLFFYPHLGQSWSTFGAIALTVANTAWLLSLAYLRGAAWLLHR